MRKIFIVLGSTGEYSDHCEWPVVAFTSESAAKERVSKASERARELFQKYGGNRWNWDKDKEPNEFDSNMSMDYTGTNYSYRTLDLES